ncbi:MAG: insulinase family protein [Clostridia bacterium]|nr:insulinase family protein [Clostridia bacterium]
METINCELLKESMVQKEYKCGLRAFVIPKNGYQKTYAMFATNFGSIDDEFILPETGEKIKVPDGVAHFLEHKLFSQRDGSAMDKFAAMGSSSNAYTSFTHTSYLFSCTDGFKESFELLLNFVQNPYITEESVENEKGIIGQEIRMYEDDPDWQLYFNFINALYQNFSVRKDIAGTVDTISVIDRELLYRCFKTFYDPSNMVILVVGGVNPEEVFEIIEKNVPTEKEKLEIKRFYAEEPKEIASKKVEKKCDVAQPLFMYGFKANPKEIDRTKDEIAVNIALEMLCGKSSDLYEELYESGLITSPLDFDITFEKEYCFFNISGESRDPEKTVQKIEGTLRQAKESGLDAETFDRTKKRLMGNYIRQFNSVDKIAHMFMADIFRGVDIFKYAEGYRDITLQDVESSFVRLCDFDRAALSVVRS